MIKKTQIQENKVDLNRSFREEGKARLAQLSGGSPNLESAEGELYGCLTLLESGLSDLAPRAVLIGDSHLTPHFKNADLYLELNQKLQSILPTLFVAQSVTALDRGAVPGENTLFSPLSPSFHRKAIASSKLCVSFHLEPVLVALANRIPAIFISSKKSQETNLANQMGVPVVVGQTPGKMVAEIEMYFAHYSWKKIDEFLEGMRNKLGLSRPTPLSMGNHSSNPRFTVCSISDSNYLPFFLGFLENVNVTSGGNFKCYLLALDTQCGHQIRKLKLGAQVKVLQLKDLWSETELPRVFERSTADRAFSTKPKLIERALKETQGPVFYCDSDVYFCQPTSSLQSVLNSGTENVVLFPHLNDEFIPAQLDGLFNAGMLGVAPGAENFLEWWGEVCYRACSTQGESGLVGDQGYLNLVPVLFDRVKIFKERFHNVARWNSRTLNLDFSARTPEQPVIENGVPVATYHAAFCDEAGVYQLKYCWDQLVSFFSPAYQRNSSSGLERNILFQQKCHWKYLDYILKLEQWRKKPLVKLLPSRWNSDQRFWFSSKGRRWFGVALKTHHLLSGLKRILRVPPTQLNNKPSQKGPDNAWVESNLKALNLSSQEGPSAQKVA